MIDDVFVNYSSLIYNSDAFIQLDNFDTYYSYSSKYLISANKLDISKYTAGNTSDPNDYSLPNVDSVIKPNKILRINPFISKKPISVFLISENENKTEENEDFQNISEESLKILNHFRNIKNKKTFKDKITLNSSDDENYEEFIFNPRDFFDLNSNKQNSLNEVLTIVSEKNIEENKKNDEINILENISNNQFNYFSNKNETRVENNYKEFSYDVNNESFTSNVNNFTENITTFTVLNEIKQELIENFNNTVNNLEQKIQNNQVLNQEIKNIEQKITNVIEAKLTANEEKIIKKIQEKSENDLKKFHHDFLNS